MTNRELYSDGLGPSRTHAWDKIISEYQPQRQTRGVVSCFSQPTPKNCFVLSITSPWDQVHWPIYNRASATKAKAAKLLTAAMLLAEDYYLEISSANHDIILSKNLWWRNFKTDAFVSASFHGTIGFEDMQYDDMPAKVCYSAYNEVAVVGSRNGFCHFVDQTQGWPATLTSLRPTCSKFDKAVARALVNEDIAAPFGHLGNLPQIHNVLDDDIFNIRYRNRDEEEENDQVCSLRRSIYSMPDTSEIKWIYG